ncbi:MAG: hypothetical protein AMXMBFR57_07930 [Acidimicrobiia bacterium]
MLPSRRTLVGILIGCLGLLLVGAGSAWRGVVEPLPESLTNEQFWALTQKFSEPDGFFQSDNLVSNEHSYQWVAPALEQQRRPNLVYLGVAPDQNFTYILALQPRMAFIVDIRRGNLVTHLMYKAIFELSADRADFLSLLFSRPRPESLRADAPVGQLLDAFMRVPADELQFRDNLLILQHHLTKTRGFPLTAEDLRGLDSIYSNFYLYGPQLAYSSRGGFRSAPFGMGGTGRGGRNRFPSWQEMAREADGSGVQRGYLASETAFKAVKSFQEKNLLVPVVGDHTGPKALREVGRYIRQHGAVVGAFYTSNVEQYLFRYGTWERFAENLGHLPVDDRSVIIRSVSPRDGYLGVPQGPDGRSNVLDPIGPLVRDAADGKIRGYWDVTGRSR